VQQATEYAKAQGARALVLETQKDNVRAQGLYEALGFVRDQKFLTYELEIHSLLK
ncbi:GNAT family N-acetyltransferase, partial [Shewanella sp.]